MSVAGSDELFDWFVSVISDRHVRSPAATVLQKSLASLQRAGFLIRSMVASLRWSSGTGASLVAVGLDAIDRAGVMKRIVPKCAIVGELDDDFLQEIVMKKSKTPLKGPFEDTESIDVTTLVAEVTSSGSFDVTQFRTTSFSKLLQALPVPSAFD